MYWPTVRADRQPYCYLFTRNCICYLLFKKLYECKESRETEERRIRSEWWWARNQQRRDRLLHTNSIHTFTYSHHNPATELNFDVEHQSIKLKTFSFFYFVFVFVFLLSWVLDRTWKKLSFFSLSTSPVKKLPIFPGGLSKLGSLKIEAEAHTLLLNIKHVIN